MSGTSGEDRGQATVELALVLPLVVLVVAGLVHVGLVVSAQLAIEYAARAGARAAATSPEHADRAALSAVERSVGDLDVTVSTSVGPELVEVEVSAPVPLLSWLPGVENRRLRADAVMRREDLG